MDKLNKAFVIIIILTIIFAVPCEALASDVPAVPFITAESAILMEGSTGKIVYAKNEKARIYPASMVKMLTAMVALEYLSPDELVVTGSEVGAVPDDSSKSGHVAGETISVLNLLRGMMMAGNESACTLALTAARRASGDGNMLYSVAERYFCEMMNQKAREIGAFDSNFVNPHGYHHENMYSTVYDMALIAREAMKNAVIRQVSGETEFSGNGAGDAASEGMTTRNYNWRSTNELLTGGDYFYQYATGIKTGYHSLSGECLAASAVKDGAELTAILYNDPERWKDAAALFDYGFGNYAYRTIYSAFATVGEIPVLKPRLQDEPDLAYLITEDVTAYIREDELSRVHTEVEFAPDVLEIQSGETYFAAAAGELQGIGSATVSVDGVVLYEGEVAAAREVLERTFSTDVSFVTERIKAIFFTPQAAPYWIIAGLLIIIITYIIIRLRRRHAANHMFSSDRKFFK